MLEESFLAMPFAMNPALAGCWQNNLEVRAVALLVVALGHCPSLVFWEIWADLSMVFEWCF
jgi:hypothetical protein